MTRNLTDEQQRDLIEAKLVAENPAYIPSRPGPLTTIALTERNTREHQFNGHSHKDSKSEDTPNKQADAFVQQLKTAMLRSAMSATTTLAEQPASIWNPAKQRNKELEKEMGYKDLGDGMCRPISFSKQAVDAPVGLAVSLSSNTTMQPASSLSLDPKKAEAAASFKDIASGAFATGGPSMIETPSIKIDIPSASTLLSGGHSVFGDHTTDTLPMVFDTPSQPKAKGHFTKAAKPVKAPEPALKLMPGTTETIDLGTGRPDAANQHFRLEA